MLEFDNSFREFGFDGLRGGEAVELNRGQVLPVLEVWVKREGVGQLLNARL